MIKRLPALLFVFLSLTSTVLAEEFKVVRDGSYRMTALDVARDGTKLWVATSWGIAVHDVSSGIPRPTRTIPLEGTTSSVVVGSSRVYVASGSKVFVLSKENAGEVLGSGSTDGTINHLLLIEPYLYAATSTGVVQFDLLEPDKPIALRTLLTSTGFALRLALAGTTLYAADGDASVEVYNVQIPSFPQGIGSFGSLPRTQAVSEAGGRLFLSDGQQTEIWFGTGTQMSRIGSMAAGGNSVVAVASGFVYLAGDDRRLRAFDVSSGSNPVKVFVSDSVSVGGTVNRFLHIVAEGSRLHVAAGDAGLLTWETSGFETPYLLRAYETDTGGSVVSFSGGVVAAGSGSGLIRYTLASNGELSESARWDSGTISTVLDAAGSNLLVSSGSRLRRFDLTKSPPSESGSVTLATSIRSAVLLNGNAIAVLVDHSVWSIDFTSGSATKVESGELSPHFVAEGGGDLAFAEFNEDGTTTVSFFSAGNLGASPVTATIEGAASSGIALSSRRVACFTFRGITTIDFSTGGTVTVLPGSNTGIARDVGLTGTTLFVVGSSRLEVWNVSTNELTRKVNLEGSASAVSHAEGEVSAVVATDEGLAAVQFATASQPPEIASIVGGVNRYFQEALLSDRTLHLWDGRDVVSLPLDSTGMPGPGRELRPAEAAIAVAAVDDRLYFLGASGELEGYSAAGEKISAYQITESADQRVISMRSVAGALWVSVEVNCLSGGCEFRTLVIDPRDGLSKTATLSGDAVAAITEGTKAWAVFDVPDEIRAIDVADPFHPAATAQVASAGHPVALARDSRRDSIVVLGDQLYVYDGSLNLIGKILEPYESDPSGRVGYIDQRVHVLGDIGVVTGRTFSPTVFTIGSAAAWFPRELPGSGAAAVRSSVTKDGKVYLLSDYALEIWSTGGDPSPRRRPVRQ